MKNSLAVTAAHEQPATLDQKRFVLFKLILQTTLVAGMLFGGANLQYLATHDALTGLPNRNLFQDCLQNALEHAEQDHDLVGIFFLGLSGFKQVYNAYVHEIRDRLSLCPQDNTNPDDLMRHADHAMCCQRPAITIGQV